LVACVSGEALPMAVQAVVAGRGFWVQRADVGVSVGSENASWAVGWRSLVVCGGVIPGRRCSRADDTPRHCSCSQEAGVFLVMCAEAYGLFALRAFCPCEALLDEAGNRPSHARGASKRDRQCYDCLHKEQDVKR
ncbi:unnamed protein product, partial [Hapterophycus canaliculatus]